MFARENHPYGHTEREAIEFMAELSRVLGVKSKYIIPAYEDAWYYMWRERRLPVNVDPLKSRLENEEERIRLSRIFQEGLKKVAGYVLPLAPLGGAGDGWRSGSWFLRSQHLFLLPGDSPIGLRLPLDSLPWVVPGDYPHVIAPDPMSPLAPLPVLGRALKFAGNLPTPVRLRGRQSSGGLRLASLPIGLCAPPYVLSHGRDGSIFSCRQSVQRSLIWN